MKVFSLKTLKSLFVIQKKKEAYSRPCQSFRMELFLKIVND